MSEYANYIEQAAYEDGLAKGKDESKKLISEWDYRITELVEENHRLITSIEELKAEVNRLKEYMYE